MSSVKKARFSFTQIFPFWLSIPFFLKKKKQKQKNMLQQNPKEDLYQSTPWSENPSIYSSKIPEHDSVPNQQIASLNLNFFSQYHDISRLLPNIVLNILLVS